jgi:predicted Zn-dependent protease
VLERLSQLARACGPAEYADARYATRRIAHVNVTSAGTGNAHFSDQGGGCCRRIGGGEVNRFVFSSPFADLAKAPSPVGSAGLAWQETPGQLRLPPVIQATRRLERRLSEIPLERKMSVLGQYSKLGSASRQVALAAVQYRESWELKHFANSLGSAIEQEQQSSFAFISLWLTNGQVVSTMLSAQLDENEFALLSQHARVEEAVRFAERIHAGTALPRGLYTAVLEPALASAIIHETVGHTLEADNALRSSGIRKSFPMGKQVCPAPLSVVDNPALTGLSGSYEFDDEGVPSGQTALLTDGRITGQLHNLLTAARFQSQPTGNGRAVAFSDEPIVRCSNTIVSGGALTIEEMIESIADGVYLQGIGGGKTYGDRFQYGAGGGYRIRNGRLTEAFGNVTIRGTVSGFLGAIHAIGAAGSQLPAPFCSKLSQPALPIWSGSPAIQVASLQLEA